MNEEVDMRERQDQAADERDIMRRIALGMDMEAFVSSVPGRHLLERAESSRAETLEKFKSVDPESPKAIRNLQCQLAVIDTIQQWMADAIADGRNAEKILTESGG